MANKKKEKKKTSVQEILDSVRADFGQESVMTLNENLNIKIDKISSGSLKIDRALGGGFPQGRMVEVFGPESSGKTTLVLHVIAEAMKKYPDKAALFVDAEHSLDPNYAQALGVDINRLLIVQPDHGEQGLNIAEAAVRSGDLSIVVVDSVDALTPLATINGEMEDRHVAPLARLMSQATRKLNGAVKKTNTLFIFVNQIRENVGVMYGNPETTVGGRALKFYTTQRVEVRRKGKPDPDSEFIQAKIKVVKNKVARPFLQTEVDIQFGLGISIYGEIADLGEEYGVIEKAGSWYKVDGENVAQGRKKFVELLKSDEKLFEDLRQRLIDTMSQK